MIEISETSYVVIVQTIVLLFIVSSILLYLLLATKKKLRAQTGSTNVDASMASIEHYLKTEIKLIEGRYNLLYENGVDLTAEFGEADWLVLRQKYLELEKELLGSTERDDHFWLELGKKLNNLVNASYLVKRVTVKGVDEDAEEEDEVKELKNIMATQNEEITNLLSELDSEDSKLEINTLKDKLTKLGRSHKELSHCIFVLEDENHFLRDQIRGLL